MAVTKIWEKDGFPAGEYIAQVTATNADTLVVPLAIRAAAFIPNRVQAAADEADVTFTPGGSTLTFSLINTTTVTGTLMVWGDA